MPVAEDSHTLRFSFWKGIKGSCVLHLGLLVLVLVPVWNQHIPCHRKAEDMQSALLGFEQRSGIFLSFCSTLRVPHTPQVQKQVGLTMRSPDSWFSPSAVSSFAESPVVVCWEHRLFLQPALVGWGQQTVPQPSVQCMAFSHSQSFSESGSGAAEENGCWMFLLLPRAGVGVRGGLSGSGRGTLLPRSWVCCGGLLWGFKLCDDSSFPCPQRAEQEIFERSVPRCSWSFP